MKNPPRRFCSGMGGGGRLEGELADLGSPGKTTVKWSS